MLDKAFPIQDKLYDEIMNGGSNDCNIKQDMENIVGKIFEYNPNTDPRDPLFGKKQSK